MLNFHADISENIKIWLAFLLYAFGYFSGAMWFSLQRKYFLFKIKWLVMTELIYLSSAVYQSQARTFWRKRRINCHELITPAIPVNACKLPVRLQGFRKHSLIYNQFYPHLYQSSCKQGQALSSVYLWVGSNSAGKCAHSYQQPLRVLASSCRLFIFLFMLIPWFQSQLCKNRTLLW